MDAGQRGAEFGFADAGLQVGDAGRARARTRWLGLRQPAFDLSGRQPVAPFEQQDLRQRRRRWVDRTLRGAD